MIHNYFLYLQKREKNKSTVTRFPTILTSLIDIPFLIPKIYL